MWELDCEEGWALKNWCFRTVVLEKTLESPLDCKEIQPVHPKGDHPGCSLEGLMLRLKLQYFGHLMWRVDSLEKTLMLEGLGVGGEGDDWGWDGWIASQTQWTWVWVNSRRWWWTGRPGVLQFMGSQRVGHDWTTELNWTGWWYSCFRWYDWGSGKAEMTSFTWLTLGVRYHLELGSWFCCIWASSWLISS